MLHLSCVHLKRKKNIINSFRPINLVNSSQAVNRHKTHNYQRPLKKKWHGERFRTETCEQGSSTLEDIPVPRVLYGWFHQTRRENTISSTRTIPKRRRTQMPSPSVSLGNIIPNERGWEGSTQILATGISGGLNRTTQELRALSMFREATWFNI